VSDDTTITSDELLVLWGGAVEPQAGRGQGLTRVSVVATPRWVFCVPHEELDLSPTHAFGSLHRLQSVDELRDQLADAPDIHALEADLVAALPPERCWELARLAAHKVNGHTLAFKERGAFTWDGLAVGPGAADLRRFLERHRAEVDAARASLASAPADIEHLGRGRAAVGTLAGLGMLGVGVVLGALAIVAAGSALGGLIGFPFVVLGTALFANQGTTLLLGEQRDRATGRAPGRLTSLRTLAAVVGALGAVPVYLIGSMLLGWLAG